MKNYHECHSIGTHFSIQQHSKTTSQALIHHNSKNEEQCSRSRSRSPSYSHSHSSKDSANPRIENGGVDKSKIISKKPRFTKEEDETLQNCFRLFGKNWRAIAESMDSSEQRVRNRYYAHTRYLPEFTDVPIILKPSVTSFYNNEDLHSINEQPLILLPPPPPYTEQNNPQSLLAANNQHQEKQDDSPHNYGSFQILSITNLDRVDLKQENVAPPPPILWSSNLLIFDHPQYQMNSFNNLQHFQSFQGLPPNTVDYDTLYNQQSPFNNLCYQQNQQSTTAPSNYIYLQKTLLQKENSLLAVSYSTDLPEAVSLENHAITDLPQATKEQGKQDRFNSLISASAREQLSKQEVGHTSPFSPQTQMEHFCPNQILAKTANTQDDEPSPLLLRKVLQVKCEARTNNTRIEQKNENAVSSFTEYTTFEDTNSDEKSVSNLSKSEKQEKIILLQNQISHLSQLLSQCKRDILDQIAVAKPEQKQYMPSSLAPIPRQIYNDQ